MSGFRYGPATVRLWLDGKWIDLGTHIIGAGIRVWPSDEILAEPAPAPEIESAPEPVIDQDPADETDVEGDCHLLPGEPPALCFDASSWGMDVRMWPQCDTAYGHCSACGRRRCRKCARIAAELAVTPTETLNPRDFQH